MKRFKFDPAIISDVSGLEAQLAPSTLEPKSKKSAEAVERQDIK